MPKHRAPLSLESECLRLVSSRIEWFSSRYCQLDFLTSNLARQLLSRLKRMPGLSQRHFQLVLADNLVRIDLSISPNQHGEEYIPILMEIIRNRKLNLIAIDLSNVLRIPDIFWTKIVPSLANLQELNLRSTNCGDQELLLISNHCFNLKQLNLSLCANVTNWSVSRLCQMPHKCQLQHLDLMQTQVDGAGIRAVLERCPALLSLKWRNTINVLGQISRDHRGVLPAPNFLIQQLISDNSYRLGSLSGAVPLCRHAIKVTIDCASHLPAEDLRALDHLHLLRELHVVLERNANAGLYLDFRDAFDGLLVKHGATLLQLSLGRIRDVDLHFISQTCPQLCSLTLERNRSYSSKCIPLSMKLVHFHLTVRDRESNDEAGRNIPAVDLSAILSSSSLKHVKIAACQTIDDATLSVISPRLESLELESCPNVSMSSLWKVIEQPCLTSLKIYRCRQITRRDIAELYQKMEQLNWDLVLDYYSDDDS